MRYRSQHTQWHSALHVNCQCAGRVLLAPNGVTSHSIHSQVSIDTVNHIHTTSSLHTLYQSKHIQSHTIYVLDGRGCAAVTIGRCPRTMLFPVVPRQRVRGISTTGNVRVFRCRCGGRRHKIGRLRDRRSPVDMAWGLCVVETHFHGRYLGNGPFR